MMSVALLFLILLQGEPLEEYKQRTAALKDSDAEGHYKLGLWCEEQKLADPARVEFEKTIAAKRNHAGARGKLGYTKVEDFWISKAIREAVAKGLTFPSEAETREMRSRGPHYAKVIDVFWERENWQVALARIEERTGLFDGTLEVAVSFGELGKIPAEGDGKGGRGKIMIDMKVLAEYQKVIDDFNKKAKQGGIVIVPPAKLEGIITHELTHCFQGSAQPAWFLEGMATWCAQDGHYVYFFRGDRQKVQDLEQEVDYKYVYARGWAFFEYLELRIGRPKMLEFLAMTIKEKLSAKEAATKVTGLDWEKLKKDEREASVKWVSGFKENR